MANTPQKRVRRKAQNAYRAHTAFRAVADIDADRLKLLAAIFIEFNGAEQTLDMCLPLLCRIDLNLSDHVISRINGLEGKIEIAKHACSQSASLSGERAASISLTLGYFMECKRYRDALIHARFHNETDEIVLTSIKHGRVDEVDVSLATLKAVNEHMYHLTDEMAQTFGMAEYHWTHSELEEVPDPMRLVHGPDIQAAYARLLECQSRRRNLPEIPEFPDTPQER